MPKGIYKRTPEMKTGSSTKGRKFPNRKSPPPVSNETREKQREAIIGEKNHFFGKKHSEETRQKMSKNSAHNTYWEGKKMSEEAKEKMSKVNMNIHRGELSPLWKGGLTTLNNIIRQCFKMRQWISDIFSRDDFTCQKCGDRGGILNAHHIKRFSVILKENNIKTYEKALLCEELWNLNNGQTLCKKCHNLIPTR